MKSYFLSIGTMAMAAFLTISPAMAEKVKGNGEVITQNIPVGTYTGISMGGMSTSTSVWDFFKSWGSTGSASFYPKFVYEQGASSTVQVTTDANLFDYIQVEVEDGILYVRNKSGKNIAPTKLEVKGTSEKLNQIQVGGGVDFYVNSSLQTDELKIDASGGTDVYMEEPVNATECSISASGGSDVRATQLSCRKLTTESSGGTDLYLSGKAVNGKYRSSGGSDIKAYEMKVDSLECHSSGGSDIYAYAEKYISAHASGGSDIHYKGNPNADTSESGGADVTHVD